ncbi:Translation factor guf1 mitochondrial, partial [Ceratobasidium sp. 395]
NFGIIAHIDHGKSTLADRLLELTGTISQSNGTNKQVLDKLKVERERGITVKAQTASMLYDYEGKKYLLNLIDTPGRKWTLVKAETGSDQLSQMSISRGRYLARWLPAKELCFSWTRHGIQAQSISVYHVAKERGVLIIPVLNKIDLPTAAPERIAAQIQSTFDISPADILQVSAKTGQGVTELLQAIIERVPSPAFADRSAKMRALLFDSQYDRYRGVVSMISLQSGQIRKGDRIASCHARKKYDVVDVGIMHPDEESTGVLQTGQVGYITCNMKESAEAHIGDTLHHAGDVVEPLPGFRPAKAMVWVVFWPQFRSSMNALLPQVFAGVYPLESNDFPKLEESIKRLLLTDRSVTAHRESSASLGQGIRLGALGSLHMDVLRQRLEDEYAAQVIVTAPTVPYRLVMRDGTEKEVSNPVEFPEPGEVGTGSGGNVREILEPVVNATIIVPEEYIGDMLDLCSSHRGTEITHTYLSTSDSSSSSLASRILIRALLPLSEIVTDFHDKVKHRSSGFASFDYEPAGYARADVVKVGFALNGKPVDALAVIVCKERAVRVGRAWVKKLSKFYYIPTLLRGKVLIEDIGEVVPRQLFEIAIQATVGSKVVARETLSAQRKDVTAGLYGGHYERKVCSPSSFMQIPPPASCLSSPALLIAHRIQMKVLSKQKEGKKKMKRIGNVELPQEAFYDVLSSKIQ